ncbi:hypothetical protein GCM10010399_82440 [Dactylosporangium fulvum]|uniref:Uncharacterized protein n=1 Tax=Dactylosporangium fulvum TaxID=53359 RepID=A0ABY5W8S2_9ACTN|nr:hypothetical protein [Dactylosporangium fulvum]UWP85884.1 hypothetical protein Dfulv_17195 [Dactylosporangium fulvum]
MPPVRRAAYYGDKGAAAVADAAAITSVAAAGASPTKAEYDALRNDVIALRTTINALLASQRAAGALKP